MVLLQTCSFCFMLLLTLTQVQGNNVADMECPATSMKLKTYCHHSQIAVPFPLKCSAMPVNYCYDAKNLLESNTSTKIYLDGHRVFDRRLNHDCWNVTTTYIKSGHWQIELGRIENVYALLIRTLGLAKTESNGTGLQVTVSRRVSTNRSESIKCQDHEHFDGYHVFFCYQSGDGALTSNYRPGYDSRSVDIFGDVYIDDSCDFSNIVKVYSYPVRVCGIPEAHHNQSITPEAYYLIGQQVTYKCSNDAHILIGNPNRTCQHDGLWSGETPICILVHNVQPQTQLFRFMENAEFYWPARNLAKAKRIDENEMITYGFETEYCLTYILLEYHSELAEGTEVSLYTTSMDGTRHVWTAGETFGPYANKQYFLPDGESFVCCLNVTFRRHLDKPTKGIFKRPEFVYRIEGAGYRRRNDDCLKPHLFPNVKFFVSQNHTIQNGVTVKMECNKGFRQRNTDPSDIQCDNGSWKGTLPICDLESCPQPNSRRHSSWKYLEHQQLKYHSVHYECHPGFKLQGHNVSTCQGGRWTTPPPKCKITFCPGFAIPSNMFCMLNRKNEFYDVVGNRTSFHHGISLECYCQPGFHVIGNRTVHCNNEQWTSELPKCQEIFCENAPFFIQRGNRSLIQQQWKIGSYNLSCPETMTIKGHHRHTSVELTCHENGEWEESELFECVGDSNDSLGCPEIAGVVVGVVLAVALTSVAYVIVKRSRKKVDDTRRVNESKRNLTIAEDDHSASYISFSCEMDDGVTLISGEALKFTYPTCDTECTESGESEVDVVT